MSLKPVPYSNELKLKEPSKLEIALPPHENAKLNKATASKIGSSQNLARTSPEGFPKPEFSTTDFDTRCKSERSNILPPAFNPNQTDNDPFTTEADVSNSHIARHIDFLNSSSVDPCRTHSYVSKQRLVNAPTSDTIHDISETAYSYNISPIHLANFQYHVPSSNHSCTDRSSSSSSSSETMRISRKTARRPLDAGPTCNVQSVGQLPSKTSDYQLNVPPKAESDLLKSATG